MQSKAKLDKWYEKRDPWNYQSNPDDHNRKMIILDRLLPYGTFDRAFDIGCGEGWITKDLPAHDIYGFDISINAMRQLPDNVTKMTTPLLNRQYDFKDSITNLNFDLIIATGVFYRDYHWQWMIDKINQHATGIVLTCNIKQSELSQAISQLKNQIHIEEFSYRHEGDDPKKPRMIEVLRIFDYRSEA